MGKTAATALPLALAISLGLGGCKTGGAAGPTSPKAVATAVAAGPPLLPPIALRPAAPAQITLRLTIASPGRIAADLDDLGRRLGIPMALGQSAIDTIADKGIAGVPVPRDVLAWLDPRRSVIGLAQMSEDAVAGRFCLAVPFKDDATARRALETVGRETARRDGESARQMPDGTRLWAGVSGATLFISTAGGHIAEVGAMALAATAEPVEAQGTVSLFPGVIGPRGEDLARAMKEDDAAGPMSPGAKRALAALVDLVADPIRQTNAVRLAVDVNAQDGIAVRVELEPAAGSAFARRLEVPAPYRLDPTLPLGDDGTVVIAWGTSQVLLEAISSIAGPSGRNGRDLARASARLSDAFAGPGSCATDFSSMPVKGTCRMDLKPGTRAGDVLDRYGRFMTALYRWADEIAGGDFGKVKVRRRGDLLEIDEPVPKHPNPSARAMAMFAAGGESRRQLLTVRDNRLWILQGADRRGELAALERGAPGPAPAAPIRAATLARTGGADGLVLFDFVSMVVRMVQGTNDPATNQIRLMFAAVPGLAALRAPLVLTVRSGARLTYGLQIPYGSLQNAAQVARPFMGVMGGPAK